MRIPFNKPFLTGKETEYIERAVASGKISGNGTYTQKCQNYFQERFEITKALLTTSCTDALEMAAILIRIKPGDEVIIPSYTFVSTANAFVLRGARILFADSYPNHPNIDPKNIEPLITSRTKAIVVVHYAGVACDMDKIMAIAVKHNLFVIEDAAQAIDSYYKGRALGSIGHLAAFSFHETKNIIAGEGGMLAVNDPQFADRAEIIWEKGTNRSAFFRGEVDKYGWIDIGSSFLPSEIVAAFLWAQLENLDAIQTRRKELWHNYSQAIYEISVTHEIGTPVLPDYSTSNGHMFYILCQNIDQRTDIIQHLASQSIHAVFHYLSLHSSTYYSDKHGSRLLPHADRFSDTLLRLPFYYHLSDKEQLLVIDTIRSFFALAKDS